MQVVTGTGSATRPGAGASARALALIACAVLTTSVTAVAAPAIAQQRSNVQAEQNRSIGQRVFSRGLPVIARYASAAGEVFTLDLSGPRSLLRFEGDDEVFTLRAQAAPRGDTVYRNDAGNAVLRISRDGGLTLYSERSPSGSPVFSFGAAEPLRPPLVTAIQLFQHLVNQSRLASRALQRSVFLDAADVSAGSEAVIAEAATVAVDALIRLARNESTRAHAVRVRRVEFVEGSRPSAGYADGTLRIVVQPDQGVAGRPSSARVMAAIQGR